MCCYSTASVTAPLEAEVTNRAYLASTPEGWFGCSPCYGISGRYLFLDLTQKHQYHTNPHDPWELIWVRFDGVQAKEYFDMLGGMDDPIFRTGDPERMKKHFADLFELFQNRPAGMELSASCILTNILTDMALGNIDRITTRLSNPRLGYPSEIQTAVSYIESHYSCPLKVEDIANHVHLSPYYFSRLFRKTTGCTVMEYIMKHRVQEAKRLLADPSHEIGTVAELVGFCNHSYFVKLFARHVGVSPSRYRQSIR